MRSNATCLAVAVAVTLTARVDAQEQPVVFVHGLTGSSAHWNYLGPSLQSALLLTRITPTLGWESTYSSQAATLHDALVGQSGIPAVAHSNGGVVVRRYLQQYGTGSRINKVVTVGSLHRGSRLADNVLDNNVTLWVNHVAGTILDALSFYSQEDPDFPGIVYYFASTLRAFALGFTYLTDVLSQAYGFAPEWLNPAPIGNEMRTNSSVIASLNSSGNLAQELANVSARVSIATYRSHRTLPFELLSNSPENWEIARGIIMAFAMAMAYYYDQHSDLYLQFNAYRWRNVFWRLYDINAAWQEMIGALVSYSPLYNRIETVPNDGVVTWTTSRYPGWTRVIEDATDGINHRQQLSSVRVRDHLVFVLTADMGIGLRSGGGTGDDPFSVQVQGMTHIRPGDQCSWVAVAQEGTPPYDYAWYRDRIGVSLTDSYTGGMNAPAQAHFYLQVRATDATGRTTQTEILVQNDGQVECLLI